MRLVKTEKKIKDEHNISSNHNHPEVLKENMMVKNKENKNTSRHTLTNKKMLGDDTFEENKCSKKALQLLADIIPWHVTKGNMFVVVKITNG